MSHSSRTDDSDDRYLLGHGEQEWQRLLHQHGVWRHTLLDSLAAHGIGLGARVLEAGCGNGALLADLADLVGAEGRAVGVEIDTGAAEDALRWAAAGRPWVEVRAGDLMQLDSVLGPEPPFDLVVSRWVLSFLPDPAAAVARLAEQLRPGGLLVVQDYDYDGIRVAPGEPIFDHLFHEVVPKAYARSGGDPFVACRLPAIYAEQGLELTAVEPHCLAGPPTSPVFGWAERFFRQHAPKLVAQGVFSEEQRRQLDAAWDRAHETPGCVFFSPIVVSVVGRKPA